MKFRYSDDLDLTRIANFYHCFGFMEMERISSEENIAPVVFRIKDLVSRNEIPSKNGYLFKGSIIEEYEEFRRFFIRYPITRILDALLGRNWLYLGSDLSIWTKPKTQPWHRDWFVSFPVVKIGLYLNEPVDSGGQLRVIAGTHKLDGDFAKSVSRALAWPSPARVPGGLNENSYFPTNYNYSSLHDPSVDGFKSDVCTIPHQEIEVTDPFKLVFFDNRLVHSGTIAVPQKTRIMLSAIFCPSPFDNDFSFSHYGATDDRAYVARELAELIVLDRIVHGCQYPYHPTGLRPDISGHHLVSWQTSSRGVDVFFNGDPANKVFLDQEIFDENPFERIRRKIESVGNLGFN
jgi:hypothetical protein